MTPSDPSPFTVSGAAFYTGLIERGLVSYGLTVDRHEAELEELREEIVALSQRCDRLARMLDPHSRLVT